MDIGKRGKLPSQVLTVPRKKRVFFRALAPLIMPANEKILDDRNRLQAVAKKGVGSISKTDLQWLERLADFYRVEISNELPPDHRPTSEKVDAIPVSQALAQGTEESGWGTSHFAAQGNSLFGRWSRGLSAIKPAGQRERFGDYGIAAFARPLQSVEAYMRNLNTHPAYTQ